MIPRATGIACSTVWRCSVRFWYSAACATWSWKSRTPSPETASMTSKPNTTKRGPSRRSDELRVPSVGPKALTRSPRDTLRLAEAQVEGSSHEDRRDRDEHVEHRREQQVGDGDVGPADAARHAEQEEQQQLVHQREPECGRRDD